MASFIIDCATLLTTLVVVTIAYFKWKPWREKRLEMALIQISVPARENYRVIKGF
jgi:hypothetical protein